MISLLTRVRSRFDWMFALGVTLLVGGAVLTMITDLRGVARGLIAAGLFIFAIAAVTFASSQKAKSPRRTTLIGAIALLAAGGAVDELLPDPYRSSTLLIAIAGLIGFALIAYVMMHYRKRPK